MLQGGADPDVTGVAPLDHAAPTDISILSASRYAAEATTTAAGAVLVTSDLAHLVPPATTPIVVADVHLALAILLPLLHPPVRPPPGVHATAVIGAGAAIADTASIGPFAVVGDGSCVGPRTVVGAHVVVGLHCTIGSDAYLHPHVTLYDRTVLGDRSILHAGVRAGADGFGYSSGRAGHRKIMHVGRCVIGSDVEIGANTTLDRGSIGDTVIGAGCKIDNLVQIGHNVRIGEHCVIAAQVGVSGSARLGRLVTLGGQAGLAGHIRIGDGATIAAQAGVFGNVPAGVTVSGYPARPHRESLRAQASLFRLPQLITRLRALERAVFGQEPPES
jgi:UDP-3-O-[3-hydroxymyristoyl] glucosamine N-acyltransferase